jgi:tripartite-type tricarboxylate transporter receptor subunit TctC
MANWKNPLIATLVALATTVTYAQTSEIKAKLRTMKPADFPSRPIEFNVGFPAGGGMDITARRVAQKFQEYSGETMIVNNRPGAGGMIFSRWIIGQASPDGYALGLSASSIIGDSLLRSENKWSWRDADGLAFVNYEPLLWVVSTSGRFSSKHTLPEILAEAKSSDLKVGTVAGTFLENLAEQVERKTSVPVLKVPFNGGKPSLNALMGDQIDVSTNFLVEISGLGDKLKPIAVAGNRQLPSLPGVPTFNQLFQTDDMTWVVLRYVIAPKNIPAERRNWLIAVFNAVMQDPLLNADLQKLGGNQDSTIDTPAKVTAELERLEKSERAFYLQTGRMK